MYDIQSQNFCALLTLYTYKNNSYFLTHAAFCARPTKQSSTWLISETLTYLLTPWSRVLLEKLASLQLVKKFPAFYGTRRFLTALTSARHLSLSWASPIQSSYPNPTSWRSIPMLSPHLHLHLVSRLRMGGVIPLLPAYIFMACAGTTLRLPLPKVVSIKQLLPSDVILQLCTLSTFLHTCCLSISV